MTCGEFVEAHIENNSHKYLVGITGVQVVNFLLCYFLIWIRHGDMQTDFHLYKFVTNLFLILAMCYFIYQAVVKKVATDLFSFLIASTLNNAFLIIRDVQFIVYPGYYITNATVDDLKGRLKLEYALSIIDIFICVIQLLIFYFMTRTAFSFIY